MATDVKYETSLFEFEIDENNNEKIRIKIILDDDSGIKAGKNWSDIDEFMKHIYRVLIDKLHDFIIANYR